MTINQDFFSGFDLNLIVVFTVLFREKNVSRTAKILGVGQPAISNSLARLRTRFNDQLFLRCSFGMEPTRLATEMYATLFPAVASIESVLAMASNNHEARARYSCAE
jgi:DNA-binding transcriptional LysR family regulator